MRRHSIRRQLLVWPQFPVEPHRERCSAEPFIAQQWFDAERREHLPHLLQAAARQSNMLRRIFRAMDDPRLVESRQPHRLCSIKLRVLKGCQPKETIAQRSEELIFGNVNLIAEDQFERFRHGTGNGLLLPAPRWG